MRIHIEVPRPVFGPPDLTETSAGIACGLGVVRSDLAPGIPEPRAISIDASPGALTVLIGPSGCGKSTFLRSLAGRAAARGLRTIAPPSGRLPDRPACDLVAQSSGEAMRFLAGCGLGDVRAMVRRPSELSDGQRARVRIAIAIRRAERAVHGGARAILVIDEFASNLDALSARALACLVRGTIRDTARFACVIAASRSDVAGHLDPTMAVVFGPEGRAIVRAAGTMGAPQPVRVGIHAGTREQYKALARMHYRPGNPATIERILSAIDADTGVVAGVLVVSRPVVFGAWRDLAWPGRYTRGNPRVVARRINREIRCISRVIVDPRFRGMGVAERLVRAYLRNPATACTESVAAMGHVSPSGGFFAAAGMTAYRTPPRPSHARLLDALAHAGIAPWRLADPEALGAHVRRGPGADLVEREARRWAGAAGRTRRWRDAPLEVVLTAAARSIATAPIAFAHTKRETCLKLAA